MQMRFPPDVSGAQGSQTSPVGVRRRRSRLWLSAAVIALVWPAVATAPAVAGAPAARAATAHAHIDCVRAFNCSEVYDSEAVFGEGVYVGHDEPSVLFYSDVNGSGNRNRFQLNLPSDPPPSNPVGAF